MDDGQDKLNPARGRLHHLAIQSRDLKESRRFYRDVLGMKEVASVTFPHRSGAFYDMGDGSLIELFAPMNDGSTNLPEFDNDQLVLWHFALAVEDVEAATERCRKAGYPIKVEPKTVEFEDGFNATISFVWGPNGEAVEFFKQHHNWEDIGK